MKPTRKTPRVERTDTNADFLNSLADGGVAVIMLFKVGIQHDKN